MEGGGLKCVFIEKEQKAFLMLLLAQTALLLKSWHDEMRWRMEDGGGCNGGVVLCCLGFMMAC